MISIRVQRCPNPLCQRYTSTVAMVDGRPFRPACAPVPDRKPHEYQRLLTEREMQQMVAGS